MEARGYGPWRLLRAPGALTGSDGRDPGRAIAAHDAALGRAPLDNLKR